MANFDVTLTAPATNTGGSPTITWTLPSGTNQTFYQIGAYRVGDRSDAPLTQAAPPPFAYHPVAASGFPAIPYGVVPDPQLIRTTTQSFTFDGSYPSTRALPNGTYIIWVHIIEDVLNDNNEITVRNNGVATAQIVVSGSTAQQPPRLLRFDRSGRPVYVAPPAPILLTPTAGQELPNGAVSVAIQMPVAGIIPSDIKIAIYRRIDWDFDRRRSNFNPVRFTDRDGDGPGARGGAEWVPINEWSPPTRVGGTLTWTVVFGASTSVPDEVPNGMWVLACKYNTEVTAAILSFDPATGLARVEHRYHSSEITVREFEVSGSTEDFTPPDPYAYMPTTAPSATWPRNRTNNEVAEPLDLRWTYNDRRGIGQRSVQVRRILSGGTNAGTRYLARSSLGVYSWVTALDTTNNTTDIPIRSEHLRLAAGTAVGTGWGQIAWGTHQFAVRPTSESGAQGDWSDNLTVDVYRRLTITALTVAVTGGFITATWTHDAATGNNAQARYRVQIFERNADGTNGAFVSGTSDRPETRDHARAVQGDNLTFTLNRTAPSLGPVKNGSYNVVVTLWDRYGTQSTPRADDITVTNTAPTAVAVTPRVYDHQDQVQVGTSGLIEGEYVGVAFGTVTGLHSVRLERRDFSRTDGRQLEDEAQTIALLPLGTATALTRHNDYLVDHGTQYEYRSVAIATSGAETEGAWTP